MNIIKIKLLVTSANYYTDTDAAFLAPFDTLFKVVWILVLSYGLQQLMKTQLPTARKSMVTRWMHHPLKKAQLKFQVTVSPTLQLGRQQ